jgi:pre-mRNA-splicing factor ATP-dependent RNA helicase DHX38/PRP16
MMPPQNNNNDRRMPPPRSSLITPASSRQSSDRRHTSSRRTAALDAPTPLRPKAGGASPRADPSASSWDLETPAPLGPTDDPDAALVPPDNDNNDDSFDRQFYLQEDEGHYVLDPSSQESGDMGRFLFQNAKMDAREKEMEKKRLNHNPAVQTEQQGRFNPRRSAMQDDQEAWEKNRLLSSGAAIQGEVSLDVTTEQDTRVTLLVHQVKPPFLDGRVSFSTVREAVPTVRDASSDFAKMAREGSETLRCLRANKDKNAMRQKFWELGGTRMGNVVGVTAKEEEETKKSEEPRDSETADGEIDYKKSTGFAAHVKKNKDGAVSDFAKTKSLRQQREFLPVFNVREELLNVIRENNIVVIVGETGSGKVRVLSRVWCVANVVAFFSTNKRFVFQC